MSRANEKLSTDGRLRRSQDSRAKITQALLDYCGEGILVPTAQEVADRAGVSLRTVFRHFSDMESMFLEMDKQIHARFTPMFEQPISKGPVAQRIADMVARRAKFYEECGPYMRSAQAQSWRYDVIRKNYDRKVALMRKDLMRWLPELKDKPQQVQLRAEIAMSFEVWTRLRLHNNVSIKVAEQTVAAMVNDALQAD